MKKSILNLGKALNKAEQKTIHGGSELCQAIGDNGPQCYSDNIPGCASCYEFRLLTGPTCALVDAKCQI
ncbi:hypothetical protein [uncultured Tenacibaculum sp.]|uniref:hypothetical protein n=1 Tax=uncultured Tenacibaculum sp. TaxID=174713 RepID=UPI00260DE7EA|nr:hypothetical protein [uncultured Tenacibaculum sp.]